MRLVSPFPVEQLGSLWAWMQEFPEANIDDYCPKTFEAFRTEMSRRMASERTWAVMKEKRRCCASIGFQPITARLGALHGVCFASGACSSEEKRRALRSILDELFRSGIEKVCATYFADNQKVAKFLSDLGAFQEGRLRRHTLRGGVPIDMIQVAIFKEGV